MARILLPTMLDYTGTALSWRSLGERPATLEDVLGIIRQYHRDSLLAALIRLNLALTHPRGPTQQEIVRTWLPREAAEGFLELARRERAEVLFHEAQVLNAIRLAVLHCPNDQGARLTSPEELRPLTRALLMMTDLIFPDSPGDRRTAVFSNFTRSELFMHDEAYLPNTMARCYDLFDSLPRLVGHRGNRLDLPGLFRRVTGLEVVDYLGLGFGVLSYYDGLDARSINGGPIAVRRPTFFKDVRLPPEVCDRAWGLLSLPIDRYRAALQAEWDRIAGAARWGASRVFTEFPLIEFPDGTLACLSRRLLRDRLTHGIYWVLANALQGEERDRFTEFFGEVFEEYARRAFLRALGRSFHPRAAYGPDGRHPVGDGALTTTRSLGVIECKAGRLLLRAREEAGEDDLRDAVERVLERAAAQLWNAIQAGQRGDLQHLGVNAETRYYPIIVTYEALPAHPFALEVYDEILYRHGRLQGDRIRSVTLLNVRDVESLEAILQGGEQWPDLLFRKHTPRYRFLPFHNYIYERFGREVPRNPYLQAWWQRIGEIIGMRLFGEPLRAR